MSLLQRVSNKIENKAFKELCIFKLLNLNHLKCK